MIALFDLESKPDHLKLRLSDADEQVLDLLIGKLVNLIGDTVWIKKLPDRDFWGYELWPQDGGDVKVLWGRIYDFYQHRLHLHVRLY